MIYPIPFHKILCNNSERSRFEREKIVLRMVGIGLHTGPSLGGAGGHAPPGGTSRRGGKMPVWHVLLYSIYTAPKGGGGGIS